MTEPVSPPQDHALPDVNTLRKMADAHGCAALGHSLSRSLRSPAEISANPSGLRSVGCALGPMRCQVDGLQTQPGDDGTHSHFFVLNFYLILFYFLAMPCGMLDLVPRPGIKPTPLNWKFVEYQPLANQAVSTLDSFSCFAFPL